jgi:hypothetical protein
MARLRRLKLGALDDDWMLGALVGKLGIESYVKQALKGVFALPHRFAMFEQGKKEAAGVTWDDLSEELFAIRNGNEFVFDHLVGRHCGAGGLAEIQAAIGRKDERRREEKDLMLEALRYCFEQAGGRDREMGRDKKDKRQPAGVVVRETCEEVMVVVERTWDRVVGVRVAEGPDLCGTGEMVKVRVRPERIANMAKGGLLRARRLTGGLLECMGPYFGSRMAHMRWSAQRRAEMGAGMVRVKEAGNEGNTDSVQG